MLLLPSFLGQGIDRSLRKQVQVPQNPLRRSPSPTYVSQQSTNIDREETNSYCSEEGTGRIEDISCQLQARVISREIQCVNRRVQRREGAVGLLWSSEHGFHQKARWPRRECHETRLKSHVQSAYCCHRLVSYCIHAVWPHNHSGSQRSSIEHLEVRNSENRASSTHSKVRARAMEEHETKRPTGPSHRYHAR